MAKRTAQDVLAVARELADEVLSLPGGRNRHQADGARQLYQLEDL
jgi:hypothetical protein